MKLCRQLLLSLAVLSLSIPAHSGNETAKQPTGLELVTVKGGCFRQGSDQGGSNERPVHEVCLPDYYIGKFEVTQRDWQDVMGGNPSRFRKCGEDCPVDSVSWSDISRFISRLNTITGRKFRLPTEAEWEFACRERGQEISYCGSKNAEALAWHRHNGGNGPHPAGRKQPNALGIFDMSGNVWEWVSDRSGPYPPTPQSDPQGAIAGATRVRRGGSWMYGPEKARATWRSSGYPDDRAMDLGFRLAHH